MFWYTSSSLPTCREPLKKSLVARIHITLSFASVTLKSIASMNVIFGFLSSISIDVTAVILARDLATFDSVFLPFLAFMPLSIMLIPFPLSTCHFQHHDIIF